MKHRNADRRVASWIVKTHVANEPQLAIQRRRFCRHCSAPMFRDGAMLGVLCAAVWLGCALAWMGST